jgi:TonB family protein
MTLFQIFKWGLVFLAFFPDSSTKSAVQGVAGSETHGVVLTKLVPPIYPPSARVTRITGDVDLMLSVRQDGVVESVVVASGHPLLKQAALDSVRQSHFECRKCSAPVTAFRLVYTFQIEGKCDDPPQENRANQTKNEQVYPQVSEAEHRVTVVALELCIVDPSPTRKIRTLKCLYIWKCGSPA